MRPVDKKLVIVEFVVITPLEIVLATVRATVNLSAKNVTVDKAFVLSASAVTVWPIKNPAVPKITLFVEIVLKYEIAVDAFNMFVDRIFVETRVALTSLNVVFPVVEIVFIKTPGIVAAPALHTPVEILVVLKPLVFMLLSNKVPADRTPVVRVLKFRNTVDKTN
jgi:hypothetical protein